MFLPPATAVDPPILLRAVLGEQRHHDQHWQCYHPAEVGRGEPQGSSSTAQTTADVPPSMLQKAPMAAGCSRRPPWISFEERYEVPEATSPRSASSTRKPRWASRCNLTTGDAAPQDHQIERLSQSVQSLPAPGRRKHYSSRRSVGSTRKATTCGSSTPRSTCARRAASSCRSCGCAESGLEPDSNAGTGRLRALLKQKCLFGAVSGIGGGCLLGYSCWAVAHPTSSTAPHPNKHRVDDDLELKVSRGAVESFPRLFQPRRPELPALAVDGPQVVGARSEPTLDFGRKIGRRR